MELNVADFFIIGIIGLSTLIGIYRGFIRELITIVTWIIAGVIAYMYGKIVGDYIFFVNSATAKEIIGMIIVFIGVVFVGFLLKLIVFKAGKISGVAPVDRLTGALFGALRGCLIIILVLLASSKNITEQDWYKKSQLMPKFTKVATVIANSTPKTWQDDIKKEVDQIMQAEQAPAPVAAPAPTSTGESEAPKPTSKTTTPTSKPTTTSTKPTTITTKPVATTTPAVPPATTVVPSTTPAASEPKQ